MARQTQASRSRIGLRPALDSPSNQHVSTSGDAIGGGAVTESCPGRAHAAPWSPPSSSSPTPTTAVPSSTSQLNRSPTSSATLARAIARSSIHSLFCFLQRFVTNTPQEQQTVLSERSCAACPIGHKLTAVKSGVQWKERARSMRTGRSGPRSCPFRGCVQTGPGKILCPQLHGEPSGMDLLIGTVTRGVNIRQELEGSDGRETARQPQSRGKSRRW